MNFKILCFLAALICCASNQMIHSGKSFYMDQRLIIVTLGVRDLGTATEFYENKFGWKKSKSSNKDISFFHLNGMELALFERKELAKDAGVDADGSGFKGFTLAYNTRSQKEADELFDHLASHGVTIVRKPQRASWGGYSGYIADPDGNLWEIAFNPFLRLDEKGSTKDQ